jgi:L-amino acid N-acyltransferase YncA
MRDMPFDIRQAQLTDIDAVLSIWHQRPGSDPGFDGNHLALHRRDFEDRIEGQDDIFKFWVATENETYLGWSSLQRMRSSPSMKGTMAEWSIYVSETARERTVGSGLAAATITHARHSSLEWVIGFVASTNTPCIGLVERFGFNRLGEFPVPKGNPRRPAVIVFGLDVS